MAINDGYVKWQWDQLRDGDWPARTKRAPFRERAPFKSRNGYTNVGTTYDDLERAIRGMPNTSWGVQARVRTHLNPTRAFARGTGFPKGDAPTPSDPSVVVEVEAKGGRLVYACDLYTRWQDNLRAIALTLEHLRATSRYGVLTDEQFVGSRALPPPGASLLTPPMTVEAAAAFVAKQAGHEHPDVVVKSPDNYKSDYRRAAAKLHPDANGGTPGQDWHTLMAAKSVLDAHHGVK